MSKELIVITGASSGIGKATAIKLSEQGYSLLLLARRVHLLEELNLPNTMVAEVDVTDIEEFKAAIEKAEASYGPVGGLINNAGVMLLGDVEVQDPAEWQTMVDVNIMGVLNGVQCVLSAMKSRKHGTIVNVSSVAGRKSFPSHAAYCATKFGVHALSETVREEVADHNVRVVVIAPGAVETELLSHTTSDAIKANYENWKTDMGGVLCAEDIANAISYAYNQPEGVCIREIVIAATRQQP